MKELPNLYPIDFHIHPSCNFYNEVIDWQIIDGVRFVKLLK